MAPAPRFTAEHQEQLIIESAINAIKDSSLLGFKMSDIAKHAGISMGSVYKHVQTKEDVLLALITFHFMQVANNFAVIYNLNLTTPERFIAINLIDKTKVYTIPFCSHLEMLLTNDAILDRCSEIWKTKFYAADSSVDKECKHCVSHAIDAGELMIPNNDADHGNRFILGLWAISVGFIHVSKQLRGKHLFGDITPDSELLEHSSLQIQSIKNYINAFNWQTPLTDHGIQRAITALESINLR